MARASALPPRAGLAAGRRGEAASANCGGFLDRSHAGDRRQARDPRRPAAGADPGLHRVRARRGPPWWRRRRASAPRPRPVPHFRRARSSIAPSSTTICGASRRGRGRRGAHRRHRSAPRPLPRPLPCSRPECSRRAASAPSGSPGTRRPACAGCARSRDDARGEARLRPADHRPRAWSLSSCSRPSRCSLGSTWSAPRAAICRFTSAYLARPHSGAS